MREWSVDKCETSDNDKQVTLCRLWPFLFLDAADGDNNSSYCCNQNVSCCCCDRQHTMAVAAAPLLLASTIIALFDKMPT